jgi:hypothetical protein
MQWGNVDHTQMQALKDPRIDGPKDESEEESLTEAEQQNLKLERSPSNEATDPE